MEMMEDGVTIRPDDEHIMQVVKHAGVKGQKDKSAPCATNLNTLSKEDEKLGEQEAALFRSCVGKLLYIAPDRPDVQYVTQGLSAFMKERTQTAWEAVKHVCRYLQGTAYDGLKMDTVQRGRSMLNVNTMRKMST